jgi:hypothetical protein
MEGIWTDRCFQISCCCSFLLSVVGILCNPVRTAPFPTDNIYYYYLFKPEKNRSCKCLETISAISFTETDLRIWMRDGLYLQCCMDIDFICNNLCSWLKLENINRGVTWLSVHFQFKLDPLLGSFSPFTALYFSFNSFMTAIFLKYLSHSDESFKFYDPDTHVLRSYSFPLQNVVLTTQWIWIPYIVMGRHAVA